ncbi:MAG TPA: OmpH family outer membrane protein [Bryobacteraceae bacterium]|nr:OmpH family outer membrane protein [Bryobacteraceae bacterium]
MKNSIFVVPVLALTAALFAQAQPAPSKVGIIQIQRAILDTKDGQKAVAELKARFDPKRVELEKKQAAIAELQQKLRSGSATLSEDAKNKLVRDIDQQTKDLNRSTEDAQAEVEQAENRVMQELGQRLMAIVNKYAVDNGYTVIIDVSNPQTPVVFAAEAADVTKQVTELYDKNAPAMGTAAPAARPAAPAPKPAAPAPKPASPAKK